jgi:hypothetical protein
MLDASPSTGNTNSSNLGQQPHLANWLDLAKKLFETTACYFPYFAIQPGSSPTQLLLQMWEARRVGMGGAGALEELLHALRSIGRVDAAELVKSIGQETEYAQPPIEK